MDIKQLSGGIFDPGALTHEFFRTHYSGNCYEQSLAGYQNPTGCTAANVTYEPGCRNDWHSHPGGQLLLVLAGKGWYQEQGKPAQSLTAGDVVEIAPDVIHWHGATKDSWYVHVAIKQIDTAGMPTWYGPVSETEYVTLDK